MLVNSSRNKIAPRSTSISVCIIIINIYLIRSLGFFSPLMNFMLQICTKEPLKALKEPLVGIKWPPLGSLTLASSSDASRNLLHTNVWASSQGLLLF